MIPGVRGKAVFSTLSWHLLHGPNLTTEATAVLENMSGAKGLWLLDSASLLRCSHLTS